MPSVQILFDTKLSAVLRSYNKGDNILYTFGIDDVILGLIKASHLSTEEYIESDKKENINEILKGTLDDIMPVGIYINGVIAIYNENTFEDFESLLEEEVNKIKDLNAILNVPKFYSDIKYIQLAVKEVLYLDDEEDFPWELKKIGSEINDEIEVKFVENALGKEYKYLTTRIDIHLNNYRTTSNENIADNCIELKLNTTEEELKSIFFPCSSDNDLVCGVKGQDLTAEEYCGNGLIFENLIQTPYKNIHVNNLTSVTVSLGHKNKSSSTAELIDNINITDCSISEELTDLYIENIAVISKGNEGKNYGSVIKELYKKNYECVCLFFKRLCEGKIVKNCLLYNDLFNSLPLTVQVKTDLSSQGKKLFIPDINQTEISYKNELKTIYNIKGLPLFKFLVYEPQRKLAETEGGKYNERVLKEHIKNPHLNVKDINKGPDDSYVIRELVKGDYLYFHYNQDNVKDAGWGCAYRSLMSVFSWFVLNTSVGKGKKIPSIEEVQKLLIKIGDKDKKILGSESWIGAVEVNLVLNEIFEVENQIMFVDSGSGMESKGRELAYHFKYNKTPIMVGGGVYAYTILGVDYNKVKGSCKFLIMDPHYVGEEKIEAIVGKGWCNWKSVDLFKKENFYNLCMPSVY